MKHTITRGETTIGFITCPGDSGAPVYGLEVLVESVVGDLEDNQVESFERAENLLHHLWEMHCAARGIECPPRIVEKEETAEEVYRRVEHERIQEEAAYYAALQERYEQEFPVGTEQLTEMYGLEEPAYGEPDVAAPERVEPDATDDDLPF